MLFYYRKRAMHEIDGYKWNGKLTQYLWKKGWLQMLVSKKHYTLENTKSLQVISWNDDGNNQIHGCKCSFEITIRRIHWGMDNTVLWKKLFPSIKRSNLQEKNVFRNNNFGSQSLLITCYFRFAPLSAISEVCYFSVYKLTWWDPVSIYLLKVVAKALEKAVKFI